MTMRRLGTALAGLLLASLPLAALAVPADQIPADAAGVERIEGANRFATAARTAVRAFPEGAGTVVIATGHAFPDALAASYLAGYEDAAVLLTDTNLIPQSTNDALRVLAPTKIVLVGGERAISAAVEQNLRDRFGAGNVHRISGPDRFFTAAAIAADGGDRVGSLPDQTGAFDRSLRTAIVALGTDFPDALAAGPLAYANRHPILLTHRDQLPEITRIVLEDGSLDIEQVLVVGGTKAVSAAVMTEIARLDNIEVVHRVAGADRTATAAAIGALTRDALGWEGAAATLAVGTNFPDALSLAPLAAREEASLVLAAAPTSLRGASFAALQEICLPIDRLIVSGGTAAVSADTALQAQLASVCAAYEFRVDGMQVAGEGNPQAAGTVWLMLGSVCYGMQVDRLTEPVTFAGLFRGAAGAEGTPVATLTRPDGSGYSADCVTDDDLLEDGLTVDQLTQQLTETPEDFYVQLYTATHGDGAVRGQVADPTET
jgi:putative cell wall-binding protein